MRTLALALAASAAFLTALHPARARGDDASPGAGTVAASVEEEFDRGQRHYARGEYRQAADAFVRVAARVAPGRKSEARYWAGLSWLGAGDAVQARSAFEDVIAAGSDRRALAELGLAQSWELAGRGDRAYATLSDLVGSGDLGEAVGTALGRFVTLARARGDDEAARRARERLLRDAPESMEAAAEHLESAAPAPRPGEGEMVVQIGAFSDVARARVLADAARGAGFDHVRVVERIEVGNTPWRVWVGSFRHVPDAKRVAARAGERLGVTTRIVYP